MENDKILELGLKLAEAITPTAHYCAVIDFSRPANEHRFFLINIPYKTIEYSWYTSHGAGSGGLEQAKYFSNANMSRQSSKGLMKTDETYMGRHGYSLKLYGQEKGVNDKVESRSIVIHSSYYVSKTYMENNKYPGRSWGCITLDPAVSRDIIDKLKNGSIVYTYVG